MYVNEIVNEVARVGFLSGALLLVKARLEVAFAAVRLIRERLAVKVFMRRVFCKTALPAFQSIMTSIPSP